MLNLNVLVQLCLIHTPRHFSGLRNTTEEFRKFEASSKKYYFESHKIHLIATLGFRRLWLHRFLVTPKTRKLTQLRVQLHPAARSTASAANVARPWRRMFQRFGQRMVDGWNQRYRDFEPMNCQHSAHSAGELHVIFLCRILCEAKSRGPSHATSGKKRKGSRTQSLPYEVLGRPCVIAFWPVETPRWRTGQSEWIQNGKLDTFRK